jgi:hypothetical protein
LGLKVFFDKKCLLQDSPRTNRKSLINFHSLFKKNDFGPASDFFIEHYSSGGDSEIEEDKVQIPSMKEIAGNLIDPNTILIVDSINDIPAEVRQGLLVSNIDEWVSTAHFKQFLEETPILM